MFLSWFDASKAKEFGASLAQFFIARIPVDSTMGERAFAQKADKVLGQMSLQVLKFKQGYRLNSYKKAQLGNSFKWSLHDAGFSVAYADKLTKWLMLQLS